MYFKYYKWDKENIKVLYNSLREKLNISEPQLYYPIMSLFFYIHNTLYSHKIIDFDRPFYISKVLETYNIKQYTSNITIKATTYNKYLKTHKNEDLFVKVLPLLDPIHYMLNNYSVYTHRSPLLPSNYMYNTHHKLNDMNNTTYIDIFFSYLVSNITINGKNPSFPIYYGVVNGIQDYKYDITNDLDELKYNKGFNDICHKLLTINEVEMNESRSSSSSRSSYSRGYSSLCSSRNSYDSDYIATIHKFPVSNLFIEKLDGTLETIIQEEYSPKLIISCLFQVSFALAYLQKYYDFSHNDLHINNVMYKNTEKQYLYYKFNNRYFKVPTYGKIFKIIDFGRSIFTYKNKLYLNDVYSKYGEAEGQYKHPLQVSYIENDPYNKKYNKERSKYFDLCRLSITILDEIYYNHDIDENDMLLLLLKYINTNNEGERFDKMKDNFDLYINITRTACNSLPTDIINNPIFSKYRIKKNKFPKRTYYSL